jgi:hypothetical protein
MLMTISRLTSEPSHPIPSPTQRVSGSTACYAARTCIMTEERRFHKSRVKNPGESFVKAPLGPALSVRRFHRRGTKSDSPAEGSLTHLR